MGQRGGASEGVRAPPGTRWGVGRARVTLIVWSSCHRRAGRGHRLGPCHEGRGVTFISAESDCRRASGRDQSSALPRPFPRSAKGVEARGFRKEGIGTRRRGSGRACSHGRGIASWEEGVGGRVTEGAGGRPRGCLRGGSVTSGSRRDGSAKCVMERGTFGCRFVFCVGGGGGGRRRERAL